MKQRKSCKLILKEYFNFLKSRVCLSSRHQSHTVKETTIHEYRKRYGLHILIETGTYMGEMVEAMKNYFEKIYSIELNEDLYKKAKEKFSKYENVSIMHGDSGTVLPLLLEKITEDAIFWLDGHYSMGITSRGKLDTPIKNEIEAIFRHPNKNHIILIDDARLFDGTNDYPAYSEINAIVKKHGYVCKKKNDIIVIHCP